MQQSKSFVKSEKSNKVARKTTGQPKPQHDGKQWQRNDNKRQQF